MFRQKGVDGFGIAKLVVGILLVGGVLFLDRIWEFLRQNGAFVLENGGFARFSDKFLLLIFIGILFILVEVYEIKRNLKR